MADASLMNSTSSFSLAAYGRRVRVLDALVDGDQAREDVVVRAINDNTRWTELRNGTVALTFPELVRALGDLEAAGYDVVSDERLKKLKNTPFAQKEFYRFLRNSADADEEIRQMVHTLREEIKAERGFLSKAFNVFSSEDPLEKVVADVDTFAQYCEKNRVSFERLEKRLFSRESAAYEYRFLIAATCGVLAGAIGINPSVYSPELAEYPAIFFSKVLPAFIVPFTALSLFKTASRDDAIKDSLLFGRFAVTMTLGAALSMGVINAEKNMGWIGPDSRPDTQQVISMEVSSSAPEKKSALVRALDDFNPSAFMLDGALVGVGAGALYGYARHRRRRDDGTSGLGEDGEFGIGRGGVKLSNFMEGQFNSVVTYGGIPAICLLLSQTIAEKGIGEFGHYGGLYATAFGSMALATMLVGAGLIAVGARSKEDWKSVFNVAQKAFSTSSGAATIDTIKDSLKQMGVSEKTRDLAPVATAFHMFGPTVCLGAIALYANAYFGNDQTLAEQAQTLGIVIASMLAVRGVPTANGALLTPVLNKDGFLTSSQVSTVNAAIIGPDRLLDMCETVVNTTADLLVLKWHDKSNGAKMDVGDNHFPQLTPPMC